MDNVVWNAIEEALRRLGKTQEWLAGELNLSNNAVTKWKQSGQISRRNAERVSELLDIRLDRLLLAKGNAVVEVLEALPLERSRAIINQMMYQIEHAEDVLTGDQITHYVSAMGALVSDMAKKKKARAPEPGPPKPPDKPPKTHAVAADDRVPRKKIAAKLVQTKKGKPAKEKK